MSESKHTPGPWKEARINSLTINVVPHSIHGFKAQVVGGGDGQMVAHAFGKTSAEAEANAHLIAATPDLLEALRWVRANYACGATVEINAHIDAAIAKAEGRS
jgi:hypothetical protein